MFSHDPHQFCKVSVWSGRPEGFESITANNQEQSVTKVGIELLGQLKINGWPTMFGYISVCSEGGGGSGLGWAGVRVVHLSPSCYVNYPDLYLHLSFVRIIESIIVYFTTYMRHCEC